jgi:V8-like Glu-specific endopeptidase
VPSFHVAPATKAPVTLVSYRMDRPNALTRQDGCAISGIEGAVVTLGCEVTFGASGSPLFQEVDGESRVTAVLSAMHRENGRIVAAAVSVAAAIGEVLAALD